MAKKAGRPSTYDEVFVTEVIRRVALGETLRAVCRDLGKVPESTFRLWVVDDVHSIAARYARAREAQAESWSDQILEIADESEFDTVTTEKDGKEREMCDHEWINRSRLKVDTRKWLMAKLHPKAFGEKMETTLTGAGGGPLVVQWQQPPKS